MHRQDERRGHARPFEAKTLQQQRQSRNREDSRNQTGQAQHRFAKLQSSRPRYRSPALQTRFRKDRFELVVGRFPVVPERGFPGRLPQYRFTILIASILAENSPVQAGVFVVP